MIGRILVILLVGCGLGMGCRPSYTDLSSQIPSTPIHLPDDSGDPAWLDASRIAFNVNSFTSVALPDQTVGVYDLNSGKFHEILTPPKPVDCRAVWLQGPLARLPNGNLGLIQGCTLEPLGIRETLLEWNASTHELGLLKAFPDTFAIGRYSFSPDMKELIQENDIGPGLNNQLYRIAKNGTVERLLSDFQRAKTPTRSPNGQTVAFWGTAIYPGGGNKVLAWPQIEDLARYPWDLYFMDADGSNPRIILPRITETGALKWSPREEYIAFGGQHQGIDGLWILNTTTKQLAKLWNGRVNFDWSPDGNQMVLIEFKGAYPNVTRQGFIFDVPWKEIEARTTK